MLSVGSYEHCELGNYEIACVDDSIGNLLSGPQWISRVGGLRSQGKGREGGGPLCSLEVSG